MEHFDLSADLHASHGVVVSLLAAKPDNSHGFCERKTEAAVRPLGGRCADPGDLGEVATHMLHFAMWDMNNSAALCQQHFSAEFWTCRYYHVMTTGYTDLIKNGQASSLVHSFYRGCLLWRGFVCLDRRSDLLRPKCADLTPRREFPALTISIRNSARTVKSCSRAVTSAVTISSGCQCGRFRPIVANVAIYVEANAHGTVVLSEHFQQAVGEYLPSECGGESGVCTP